jgi:ferrous iron transport protein B
MELPKYAMPPSKLLLQQAINRVKNFLINAGLMIILVCTVIAILKQWDLLGNLILNSNLIKYIMLIFKPMGILDNNWPAIAGLASGIVAKEAIIASLNSLYTVSGQEMAKILYVQFGTYKAAFAYLLFVLLSFPCVSVIASIYKELNLRWAAFAVAWTTGLAYVMSVCYYQLATFAEHPVYSAKVLLLIISILVIVLLIMKIKFARIKKAIWVSGQVIPMAID